MFNSKVLEKLRAGKAVLCTNASAGPSPMVIGLAAQIGFDAIWLDGEHRAFTEDQIGAMIMACRAGGADPLIRIRKESPASIFRPLEMAAAGVMVPHVMTPKEAEWAVRNFRYAPQGLRGMDCVGPDADYALAPPDQHMPFANRESWLALQVEDREAVECIEEIAAVPGFDVVFIGPGDLSQSLGVPLQMNHPNMQKAIDRIVAACQKNGKVWGQPAASLDHAKTLMQKGARFITIGADLFILLKGWRELHDGFRSIQTDMGL